MINATIRPRTLAAMTLLLPGLTGACAHVGQKQFDAELASLRQQIEEGDRTTLERVDDLGRLTDDQMEEMSARLDGLARSLTTLRSEFDVTVERLESAVRFDMPVYFAFDQSVIRSEDRPVLDRFSTVVMEFYPEALITVEGFTDRAGSVEYNRALGQQRADAVREYLVKLGGFEEGSVRTVSYGEDAARLVAPDQAGRDKGHENRRVALVIEHLGTTGDQADIATGSP
jgi:outer membrane protein OmpA-like peptidoglycan-associated protein